jgi:small-conductance mechanosensitive channel
VARDFRKRILEVFNREGIEIPHQAGTAKAPV